MGNGILLRVDNDRCAGKPERSEKVALWCCYEAIPDLRRVRYPPYCHEAREYQEHYDVEYENNGSNGLETVESFWAGIDEGRDSSCGLRAGKPAPVHTSLNPFREG
jgi:hypothetical protein